MAEQTGGQRARRDRGVTWGGKPRRRLAAAMVACAVLAPVMTTQQATAVAYDPAADGYSMKALTQNTGVTTWWDQGYTGAGVDVALIDTGVTPVEGLATPGKIVYGPDLSLESQSPNLTHLDTNGHGTFMAGLIAGKDADLTAPYENAPASVYRGIAPDARIVSLKVGVADGGVDVTQVIAAINWVVDNKTANGLNIRVLSLAYAAPAQQSSTIDPLSFAVERAWKAGIVVVTPTGNAGYIKGKKSPQIASPAFNPFVIAVGGYDTKGTAATNDDAMGSYSQGSCASPCKKPDFSAVGSRLQGLRVPNSFIDANHGGGVLGTRYFRGSGTSQATAITAGAIALMLQKYPAAQPDQVKKFIVASAGKLPGSNKVRGAGSLDMSKLATKSMPNYRQSFDAADGTGSIEVARAGNRISRDGVPIVGEVDIFGKPFNKGTAGSSWSGGTWNGSTWSGSTWSGSTWSGSTWSGSTWSGSTWSGSTWSGSTWSGSTWSGSTWSGSTWSGSSWSGSSWSTGIWATSDWS